MCTDSGLKRPWHQSWRACAPWMRWQKSEEERGRSPRRSFRAPAAWSTRKRRRRVSSTREVPQGELGEGGNGSEEALLPRAGASPPSPCLSPPSAGAGRPPQRIKATTAGGQDRREMHLRASSTREARQGELDVGDVSGRAHPRAAEQSDPRWRPSSTRDAPQGELDEGGTSGRARCWRHVRASLPCAADGGRRRFQFEFRISGLN